MVVVARHKPASASPKASKEGPVSVIDLLINEMFRFPLHFIVKCSSLATTEIDHRCYNSARHAALGRANLRAKTIHLMRDLSQRTMLTQNMASCP